MNLFLNRDCDIAIAFRYFILQMLEADCLAFVLNVFLVHRRLSLGTPSESDKIPLARLSERFTISDALDCILRLKAI